jgi:hypothetical protein
VIGHPSDVRSADEMTCIGHCDVEIFKQKYIRDRAAFFDGSARTSADIELWTTWVKAVWMPTNHRIYDILVSHGDLIVDDAVPKVFLDLCAHIQSYKAVLSRWESGDHSVLVALIDHPGAPLLRHVEERYLGLKEYQAELLATTAQAELLNRRFLRHKQGN